MAESVSSPITSDSTAPAATPVAATGAEPVVAPEVEVQGVKHVPLTALLKEREEAKAAKVKAAEQQAYIDQTKPIIDLLQAHPELIRPDPGASQPASEDAEIRAYTELAKTLDLYDQHAKPDIEKAKKISSYIQHIASRAVGPVREQTSREISGHNFQRALQVKSPEGRTPHPDTLAWMWKAVPVEYSADERVAAILAYSALGYDTVHGKTAPAPPAQEPLVTEPSGGRTGRRTALTSFDEAVAKSRGISTEKYKSLTEGFEKGTTNILED